MSHPAAVSSAICCRVALTSWVLVVHMDCTEMGWSLPTPTLPTLNWRVLRRGASVGAGGAGIPSPIGWPVAIVRLLLNGAYWNSLMGLIRSAVTVSAM